MVAETTSRVVLVLVNSHGFVNITTGLINSKPVSDKHKPVYGLSFHSS